MYRKHFHSGKTEEVSFPAAAAAAAYASHAIHPTQPWPSLMAVSSETSSKKTPPGSDHFKIKAGQNRHYPGLQSSDERKLYPSCCVNQAD